jgi:AmmeMemoRadiSam system protein A
MMEKPLTQEEREILLSLARESIVKAVNNEKLPTWSERDLTQALKDPGASFVTLTKKGQLRGCIGSLEAHQSLVKDVQEHAVQAALDDYRFPPVNSTELAQLHIEISRLTPPQPLNYTNPEELPALLKPEVDGVILKDGFRRATFLPQVWRQLPDVEEFLSHLCMKMGAPADQWRRKKLEVFLYFVEEFEEPA